jgi:hypothetical protein
MLIWILGKSDTQASGTKKGQWFSGQTRDNLTIGERTQMVFWTGNLATGAGERMILWTEKITCMASRVQ